MHISTDGIVLKQRKIANNRRIIVIFTREYGKISAGTSMNEKGRGKAALALRPFTYAEYDLYKGRGYYNINGANVNKSYYAIGDNLDRFMAASTLLEFLDKILEEEQPRKGLFDLTLELLDSMINVNKGFNTLLYAYLVKTLRMNGIMPEIERCVDCGRTISDIREQNSRVRHFSITAGGIICDECVDREKSVGNSLIFEPHFDIVEVLRYFMVNPIKAFEKVNLKPEIESELREILSSYLDHYLDVDILKDDQNLII